MVDPGAISRPVLHVLPVFHLVGGVLRKLQLPVELVFDQDIQGHVIGVHPLCRLIPWDRHDFISL